MKTLLSILLMALLCAASMHAQRRICVEKNGLQPPGYDAYAQSIMQGIGMAATGDVVKVFPGKYQEKVTMSSNIILEGSGAEATEISYTGNDRAVVLSAGVVKWFTITSGGNGALVEGNGTLTNCVVTSCGNSGIVVDGDNASVQQCLSIKNASSGIYIMTNRRPVIRNNICSNNQDYGYQHADYSSWYQLQYNAGQGNVRGFAFQMKKGTNCIEVDVNLDMKTLALSGGSKCIDSGHPALHDPDGTPSDMGYYGGDDAPTFPVMVYPPKVLLNPDGTLTIEATGVSRY